MKKLVKAAPDLQVSLTRGEIALTAAERAASTFGHHRKLRL